MQVRPLNWEDLLEKGNGNPSSIPAWEIPIYGVPKEFDPGLNNNHNSRKEELYCSARQRGPQRDSALKTV